MSVIDSTRFDRLREFARPDRVFDFMAPAQSPVDVRHGPILYLEDVSVSFDVVADGTKVTLVHDNWDAHGDLKINRDRHAGNTDRPIAGWWSL